MTKQIEEELKAEGYAIVEEDGKAYLHITSQLSDTLQNDKALSDSMTAMVIQKSVRKIIVH